MKIKKFRSICSVMGCRNTDTYLISRNSVTINTPNICKECLKMAYLELFPEEAEVNVVDEAVDEVVEETENAVDEATEETNEGTAEDAKETAEAEEEETILGGIPKKKTRKKE